MPPVVVRQASLNDLALVREVRLRALADAPEAFASTLEREAALDDDEWRRRVAPGNWSVALAGNEPVGCAACVREPEPAADEWQLVAMWVAPEHRGRGIAERLVEAVRQRALAHGAAELGLWVAADNTRAVRFYERLGFRRTGDRQPLPNRPQMQEDRMRQRLGGQPSALRRCTTR